MNTVARIDQQELVPYVELDITARPAQVLGNFSQVKQWLIQELERFDLVVTEDTLTGAKRLAADLNKYAADFDQRRKDTLERLNQPTKLLEANIKDLVKMCKDGRQKLVDQIVRFEDEKRAQILAQIVTFRDQEWERLEVQIEFRTAQVDDLAKLTAVTKAGNLTAATVTEIGHRVGADKQRQEKQRLRLLQLETESSRAGLAVPVTREHVQHFLNADDDGVYEQQLHQVIQAEIGRQEQAEQALRAKIQREQLQAQAEPAPVPGLVPEARLEPMPTEIPRTAQAQTAKNLQQRYAVGPLADPTAASLFKGEAFEVEAFAYGLAKPGNVYAIWTPDEPMPIALLFGGDIYRN